MTIYSGDIWAFTCKTKVSHKGEVNEHSYIVMFLYNASMQGVKPVCLKEGTGFTGNVGLSAVGLNCTVPTQSMTPRAVKLALKNQDFSWNNYLGNISTITQNMVGK